MTSKNKTFKKTMAFHLKNFLKISKQIDKTEKEIEEAQKKQKEDLENGIYGKRKRFNL